MDGFSRFFSVLVSVILFRMSLCTSLNSDGLSLLALKSAVEKDPTRFLNSWSESDLTPCHWPGITCARGRVTSLVLVGRGLSGYIPSELGLLDSLSRLELAHNNFSKPVPARLFDASNLRHLDLSHNSLTGTIPAQIRTLKNLTHLDFSSNLLNGSLPESLTELRSLVGTLNLSNNRFSGEIPPSYGQLPVFVSLDLGYNNLTGKVPQMGSLLNQGPTAFAGNPSLCGFPVQTPCAEPENPTLVTPKPENPRNLQKPKPSFVDKDRGKNKQITGSVTVSLISGVSVVIGALSLSVWLIRRKWSSVAGKTRKERTETTAAAKEFDEEGQDGKFVVVDEGFELELEDMLRASAYVVGKSRSGIVYKVVAGRGSCAAATTVVAVRRLSEGDAKWRFKDFEAEVEAIGRIHHPNIVRLRAYYYSDDEKLLITDFVHNGSLYSALHGGPSNTLPPLSWPERLRIAQGTAQGLVYIHEHSPKKYVHGNLKSTKILLDDELQPHISGLGLTRLGSGYSKFTNSHSTKKQNLNQPIITSVTTIAPRISAPTVPYLAPEAQASSGSKLTQKCDVYAFGIILLELLTGRVPNASSENEGEELESLVRRWFRDQRPLAKIIDPALLKEVYAKKQVVAAFHLALNCTETDPEVRPRMRTVSESLGRIKSE